MSCDIKLDDTLDRTLEDGAKQHNLTVVNVRNILHVSAGGLPRAPRRARLCATARARGEVALVVALDFENEGDSVRLPRPDLGWNERVVGCCVSTGPGFGSRRLIPDCRCLTVANGSVLLNRHSTSGSR